MKKLIIGAVVGALILFIWQFLSWSVLKVHEAEYQYSENEAEVLAALEGKLDDGMYFMPMLPPGSDTEAQKALMKNMEGKPWVHLSYHSEYSAPNAMNFIRAFFTNLFACLLLCWILLKIPGMKFTDTLLITLGVGLVGFSIFPYLNSIWFETSTMGYLVDTIVEWGLVGAWLGWWLNR